VPISVETHQNVQISGKHHSDLFSGLFVEKLSSTGLYDQINESMSQQNHTSVRDNILVESGFRDIRLISFLLGCNPSICT